jgi:precorrin-3B methylase
LIESLLLCLVLILDDLLCLFSWLAQIFGYAGINLSSATLGTAMLNLIPGLTFILAVAFRLTSPLDFAYSLNLISMNYDELLK